MLEPKGFWKIPDQAEKVMNTLAYFCAATVTKKKSFTRLIRDQPEPTSVEQKMV